MNHSSQRPLQTRAHHLVDGVLFSVPLLLAVWLYGYSITLPFFLDDGPHFQILAQTNGIQHWGDFPPFPFYRPFTFTIWKLFAGEYSAPLLHLLNVLCFGLAGVVLGQLVRRMLPPGRRHLAGVLAGCLFVLFPFSYQAVAMVAALFHLTLTLGLLLCLWAASVWLAGQGGYAMLILCWVAAFCGVFSHENGVLLLPLLVGFVWLQQRVSVGAWRIGNISQRGDSFLTRPHPPAPLRREGEQHGSRRFVKSPLQALGRGFRGRVSQNRHDHPVLQSAMSLRSERPVALVLVPVALIVAAYVVLWLSFRPQETNNLNTAVDVSLAVLLQGLVYPFAALLRPVVEGDVEPGILLVLAGIVVAGVMGWGYWSMHRLQQSPFFDETPGRTLVFGLGWYILAVLPAVILLPAGYVLGQPRLALLASAGGGIFWGVVLAYLIPQNHAGVVGAQRAAPLPTIIRLFLLIGMIGLFIYVSVEFLAMRRNDLIRLRDFNRQAVDLLDSYNAHETGVLLVNVPDYLTPDGSDRRFLLGTEGVLFVDETLDYNQQFWMNSDTFYQNIDVIAYDQIQRNTGYGFRAHPPALSPAEVVERVRYAPLVIVTQFENDGTFFPVLAGGTVLTGDNMPDVLYPSADFALTDARALYHEDKNLLQTEIRWQAGEPAAVKLFVHVYCGDEFIAQSDGYPWGDMYPFAAWIPDEIKTDIRFIRVPVAVTRDCLQVFAGLYYEVDVSRLEALSAEDGSRYPEDVYPIVVE